jgi:two-component system NtrC family sensor kinase
MLRKSVRRISIKAKLISSYLIILGAGGLATSLLGSWIVSSTLLTQVRRTVEEDFATAKSVYDQQLQAVRLPVEFTAAGTTISGYLAAHDQAALRAYLINTRDKGGYDFLSLTDSKGHVLLRTTRSEPSGDDVGTISLIRAAMSGKLAVATESVSAAFLRQENPRLANAPIRPKELVLLAAAPVRDSRGGVQAVLYGGVVLAGHLSIVDSKTCSTTIFQGDTRIATNVPLPNDGLATGSRASLEVVEAVLRAGQTFRGRTHIGDRWFISQYGPLRDYSGEVVGMLSVGVPENIYTEIRNQVIFSFFGIATIGFIVIMAMTYYMVRNITQPLSAMVAATHNITAGRFDQEVHTDSPGEIAALADSFNAMLYSLRNMKGDLEEWGRTLEQKVKQRTMELAAMQARVAQSERLASLGMLAAGVAHEVNNPLGGILALTSLTLEDMPPADPNRENLEEVIRQTERCRDIVNRLLEFSRQSKTNAELVDLNDILERTLALIGKQSMFFNVMVVKNYHPVLPAVLVDRSQFQQVFMNLLMNAVQAMNERGTLTVTTRPDATSENVEVVIADTGCGIPLDQINRIFDPFFTTKDSGQGTGLGLSIAYGIVTTHRGSISVQSETGKGSTFTIRVPVAPADELFAEAVHKEPASV